MGRTKEHKKSKVLEKYKKMSLERGHALQVAEVRQTDELPGNSWFSKNFGGLRNVRQILGFTKGESPSDRMFCRDCVKKMKCNIEPADCKYYDQADLYFEVR